MELSKKLKAKVAGIKTELNFLLNKKEAEFTRDICFEIIYDYYASDKYEVTHDWDPPYDCSGLPTNKYEQSNINEYDTVGDFLDERTGDLTLAEYYRNKIEEKLCEAVHDFISAIDADILYMMMDGAGWQWDDEVQDIAAEFVVEFVVELADDYGFTRDAADRAAGIMEKIRNINFRKLRNDLEDSVREKIFADKELKQKKAEAARLRVMKEEQEFSIIWERLETNYHNNYKEKIPDRIEASQFPEFLRFLRENDVNGYAFKMIAKYAPVSFSNSVSNKLKRMSQEKDNVILNDARVKDKSVPMGEEMLRRLFKFLSEVKECDNTLKNTKLFFKEHNIPEDVNTEWLKKHGGYCDCEILYNVRCPNEK